MYLCFFDAVADADYLPDEDRKASYWKELPTIGSPIALGGHRPWEIVGVDVYHDPAHPENRIHLYHCDIEGRHSRDQWPLVQRNRERPQTLHIYLGDSQLVHWSVSLEGPKNLTGFRLPQYDPAGKLAYFQPWAVEAVQVFYPEAPENRPCYSSVVLGKCSYLSEATDAFLALAEVI